MKFHKFSSVDAFVGFDLPDAPATGVARRAKKVLRGGAEMLARSTTYSFASFEVRMGGGSCGINAVDEDREAAVAAFVAEARALVADGHWTVDPGLGLSEGDLAPLREVDPRPDDLWETDRAAELIGTGAVAAAVAVLDGLDGHRAAIVGPGPEAAAARSALADAGGDLMEGVLVDADVDVVFIAGKTGVIDHDLAASISARAVVPLTPLPVTARAYAVLDRAGTVYIPDFLSIAAPLLHAHDGNGGDPVERVARSVTELADSGTRMWHAAIERAEGFLSSWQDELPFGRPLA